MRAGRFITFEGPEGSGKTTQAKRLVARLCREGRDVVYTREPGGTPTGEAIRDILQHNAAGEPICDVAEVFLFAASRAQLVRAVILPALSRGAIVISDRFADSTTAYQGYGRGFPIEQMLAINAFAIGEATPDLTILLDLPVSIGFERIRGRQQELFQNADRIEREALEFHERVRGGYLELAHRWPARFRIVDATRPPDDVERAIWEIVSHAISR
jgi:dTMP kinase